MHDRAAFVIFDIAHPARFLQSDIFGEALLFEVANGVVVGVSEEMLDWGGGFDIIFEVGHEMGAVAFDLLVGGDGAEDYFSEFAAIEGTVGYSPAIRIRHHAIDPVADTYPTTSSGFLTIAIDRWVRS